MEGMAKMKKITHIKNIKTKLSLIMLGLAAVAQPVLAEDAGKFYINPAVGYKFLGSDRNLEDALTGSIGGEYVLMPNMGVEASYLYTKPEGKNGGIDVDVDQYTLDALYYITELGDWKPFLNAGVGHGAFDFGFADADETQLNLGGGTRYQFNDNWSARIQAKAINSLDEEVWDALLTVGISYAFGGKSKPVIAPVVAVLDNDNDGIADEQDLCLTTPAGVSVDASGCALDGDNDGVADYRDNCPDSLQGEVVEADGCKKVVMKTESVKLAINFANNSADVPAAAMSEIKVVADFIQEYPAASVIIEGYTDSIGDADYNKKLSQRRADSVMQALIKEYDISKTRVSAVGYGKENPIADNNTEQGRRENRRVIAQISLTPEQQNK
ncbi:MAG: OOP family OmpA-OmpF porin [Moritella sp.]|jgi:OOP family OmpA-OmpF porin